MLLFLEKPGIEPVSSFSDTPLSYTNWVPNRKTSGHNIDDCVIFLPYVNHGQWDDVQCGGSGLIAELLLEKHYFICQFRR